MNAHTHAPSSAGLLMFCRCNGELELLLAHPGGPFWKDKDEGAWTIPVGEAVPGEDLLVRACIEFQEDVGWRPEGEWIPLGSIRQRGGEIVHAWGFADQFPDEFEPHSKLLKTEWPPGSGHSHHFPTIDLLEFFPANAARAKINPVQAPFIERLQKALARKERGLA